MKKQGSLIHKSINISGDILVAGYASVFDVVDQHNDIVAKGAFQESLSNTEKTIKFLWQHEASNPIGRIEKILEDNYGLYIEAVITSGTIKGREAIDLVTKKIINGLSIGFNVVKSYIREDSMRIITELDLWEVSLVTFPANSSSEITASNLKTSLYPALQKMHQQITLINQRGRNGVNYQNSRGYRK